MVYLRICWRVRYLLHLKHCLRDGTNTQTVGLTDTTCPNNSGWALNDRTHSVMVVTWDYYLFHGEEDTGTKVPIPAFFSCFCFFIQILTAYLRRMPYPCAGTFTVGATSWLSSLTG